jgi:pimeloyl-ACP methyl ester carboxylesterase
MADDVALRLHALTGALALPAPYIVVGHSLGGFYAQVFARRYPKDVAAVVLVDAASQFEPPGVFVSKSTPKPGAVALPRQAASLPFRPCR